MKGTYQPKQGVPAGTPCAPQLKVVDAKTGKAKRIINTVFVAIDNLEKKKGKIAMRFHRHFTNDELYYILREYILIKHPSLKGSLTKDDIRRAIRFIAHRYELDKAWLKIAKCDENGRLPKKKGSV